MAAVSRAPACLDPGVTGGHSCSDSLCKHPLPAGPPPPSRRPAGLLGSQARTSGSPEGGHRPPRGLRWAPGSGVEAPPGQPEARRGDRLCQGFSGKTRVGSVCSQGRERPGGSGRPRSSGVASASCSTHTLGPCPSPPPGWPLRGAPPPETPTLQPCFPSALRSLPELRPHPPPTPGAGGCWSLSDPTALTHWHPLQPRLLLPARGGGVLGRDPPSLPPPLSPSVLPSLLCLTTSVSRGLSITPDTQSRLHQHVGGALQEPVRGLSPAFSR